MALKYIGANFEHWKICEWATKSIQAYKDVHFTNDNNDYSKELTQVQIVDYLAKKGVSMNYNEPMTIDQIKRKGEKWQRTTYNNIISTHNLVNISQVKGQDLKIVDTDKYDYILTYSFPCQDLSLAGKRAGMEKDSGTRSGLLWEVERILDECKELGALPKILLMENVPEIVGANNIEHFKKWRYKLEQLGYSNYDKILNAKDYGIPQNRRRCFMVSILGEYNYNFPQEISLKFKQKDMLELEVDEKYYLTKKMITYICGNAINKELKDVYNREEALFNKNIAYTLTTKPVRRVGDSNYIVCGIENELKVKDFLAIIEKNKIKEDEKFYLVLCDQTINKELSGTIKTEIDIRKFTNIYHKLRVRKLTPREYGRLMGVRDEYITKMSKNQSDASLYHLFGDSIVVDVLKAIFLQLLEED